MRHYLPRHYLALVIPAEHPIPPTNRDSNYSSVKLEAATAQVLEVFPFRQISTNATGFEYHMLGQPPEIDHILLKAGVPCSFLLQPFLLFLGMLPGCFSLLLTSVANLPPPLMPTGKRFLPLTPYHVLSIRTA